MVEIQEVNIEVNLDRFDIIAGLRRRHKEFLRESVYDGHNRHPGGLLYSILEPGAHAEYGISD